MPFLSRLNASSVFASPTYARTEKAPFFLVVLAMPEHHRDGGETQAAS